MRDRKVFLNTILGVVIVAGCSSTPVDPMPEQPAVQASLIKGLLFPDCANPVQFDVRANTSSKGSGNGNGIEFRPEGLRFSSFALPLIVYTDDLRSILEVEPSVSNLLGKRVTG